MAQSNPNVVSASSTGPKLPDGVVGLDSLESSDPVARVHGLHALQRADRRVERPVSPACPCSIPARPLIRRTSIPRKSS